MSKVTMRKPAHRDMEVDESQVAGFEKAGFTRLGDAPAVEAAEESGLSDAEKQTEIDAAVSVARGEAEDAGLDEADVDAAGEAAGAKAKAELDG